MEGGSSRGQEAGGGFPGGCAGLAAWDRRLRSPVDDVVGLITVSRRPQGSGGVTASDSVRINRRLQITKTK